MASSHGSLPQNPHLFIAICSVPKTFCCCSQEIPICSSHGSLPQNLRSTPIIGGLFQIVSVSRCNGNDRRGPALGHFQPASPATFSPHRHFGGANTETSNRYALCSHLPTPIAPSNSLNPRLGFEFPFTRLANSHRITDFRRNEN